MVEGSDATVDTALYIRSEGGEPLLVPVRPENSDSATGHSEHEIDSAFAPLPEPHLHYDQQPTDIHMNCEQEHTTRRDRSFYMKKFVAQVDEIMQAMQARESLPESVSCAECGQNVAEWRCDDCIGGKILCRFCMRQAHFPNPFHRIECWTGTHFQKAALWEVGVCLVLPHQSGPSICPNLSWQQGLLEKLQKKKDTILQKHIPTSPNECDYTHAAESATDLNQEASQDEATMQILDELLNGHNPDEVLEEDETNNQVDTEADIQDMDTGTAGFTNYMHHILGAESANPSQSSMPFPPNCDALSNQYVRVVHTNGIHHIALLSCTCQGHERITTDLIYAG
jgi:hypothetical protein